MSFIVFTISLDYQEQIQSAKYCEVANKLPKKNMVRMHGVRLETSIQADSVLQAATKYLHVIYSVLGTSNWRRKWQPTPVFLPGESQGRRSLVGCRLWGRRVGLDSSDLAAAAAGSSNTSGKN